MLIIKSYFIFDVEERKKDTEKVHNEGKICI